jgi:hypothetical protein
VQVQNHQDFDFVLSPIADPQVPMPDHEPGETSRAHGISLDPAKGTLLTLSGYLYMLCDLLLSSDAAPTPSRESSAWMFRHLETDAAIQGVSGWQPTYLHEGC